MQPIRIMPEMENLEQMDVCVIYIIWRICMCISICMYICIVYVVVETIQINCFRDNFYINSEKDILA